MSRFGATRTETLNPRPTWPVGARGDLPALTMHRCRFRFVEADGRATVHAVSLKPTRRSHRAARLVVTILDLQGTRLLF